MECKNTYNSCENPCKDEKMDCLMGCSEDDEDCAAMCSTTRAKSHAEIKGRIVTA